MNRNVESYFSTVPSLDIQRSSFDMSQDIKFSFDVGELIPFYVMEVLPGDTFKLSTSKVVRLQTLLTPVMDNIYLDTYFFFVPYRLTWTHWRELMGQNSSSAWLPAVEYSVPQIYTAYTIDSGTTSDMRVKPCSAADYMGIPVNVPLTAGEGAYTTDKRFSFSALPLRAYQLIWTEWFRDENLTDPANVYLGDNDKYYAFIFDGDGYLSGKNIYPVAKYHDYFTSCLPAPLKGSPVLAPVESSNSVGIPVGTNSTAHTYGSNYLKGLAGSTTTYYLNKSNTTVGEETISNNAVFDTSVSNSFKPTNLYGDISTLGINIMSLRNAFQVQKLLERDARGGTRYTELIRSHFSVQSPDSRLQRPEYLGGNRIPISIHQITNQSQGENDFLGDLGAMSLTTDRNEDFVYSSTEHGVIIGVCCARYDHSYPQGLQRFWSRKTRFDFYWPEMANISEMAVLNKEIYAQGTDADNQVFGYQEAWADYRYAPNRVAGEMRPGIDNTLASWHFSDYYESKPTLSNGWIRENKSNVDRTLAVTSEVANQIFCDVYVDCIATRPMPVRSIPGLADHF